MPEEVNIEVSIAREDNAAEAGLHKLGDPSNYACPECHGVLLEMKDHMPLRFRCQTGHAYTIESLLADMDEMIEDSLWSAIRALEERVMLVRQAAAHLRQVHGDEGGELLESAEETQRRADLLRRAAMSDPPAAKTGGAAG